MKEVIFDVYNIRYRLPVYGIVTATVASGDSLTGAELLLKKKLSEIKINNENASDGLELLAIEKLTDKSNKEGILNLGIKVILSISNIF